MAFQGANDLDDALASCMKCGFCKAACPLFLAEETTSPGCDISTALELDVAFGTVFHVMGTQWPTYQAPACTR